MVLKVEQVIEAITDAYKKMDYRPTVVMIVQNEQGKFLLVCSSHGQGKWGFPQGGVNCNEEISSAITRELFEEVGIKEDEFTVIKILTVQIT